MGVGRMCWVRTSYTSINGTRSAKRTSNNSCMSRNVGMATVFGVDSWLSVAEAKAVSGGAALT